VAPIERTSERAGKGKWCYAEGPYDDDSFLELVMALGGSSLLKRVFGYVLIARAVLGALPFLASALFHMSYPFNDSELVPRRGSPRYITSSENAVLYDDSRHPVLTLAPEAKVYVLESQAVQTRIEVYGWIWSDSLTRQGTDFVLLFAPPATVQISSLSDDH
jgi:hypothetical protein